MALDFSLDYEPSGGSKLEKLFSPCVRTPTRRSDITYYVPNRTSSDSYHFVTPTSNNGPRNKPDQTFGDPNQIGLPSPAAPTSQAAYPRHSTEIKSAITGSTKGLLARQATQCHNFSIAQTLDKKATLNIDVSTIEPAKKFNNSARSVDVNRDTDDVISQYRAINMVQYAQPVRAVCFHPSGQAYLVGSNTRQLDVYAYPSKEEFEEFTEFSDPSGPRRLFSFCQLHRGSIYSAKFNSKGDLLATSSNDQTVHITSYDADAHMPGTAEYKLTMHTGTVREVCFMNNVQEHDDSLLLSAGAGDYNIHVTDCKAMRSRQALSGHSGAVMSLHCWLSSASSFVSASTDGTIRFWDLRSSRCTSAVNSSGCRVDADACRLDVGVNDTHKQQLFGCRVNGAQRLASTLATDRREDRVNGSSNNKHNGAGDTCARPEATGDGISPGSSPTSRTNKTSVAINAVRVDPSGKLLMSGHSDGTCMLYDIRGARQVQTFKAHEREIRSLNFSPKCYYVLTGGYDCRVKLMDIQGDLGKTLPSVDLVELGDKVVQTNWHPSDYSFLTSCADGSAILWAMPCAAP